MPYRHSDIPNFKATDRSIPSFGMLRLRKGEELEDGSHSYTSGVWTNHATEKTSIKIIVQEPGDAKLFDEAAIVNLSSGFLAFAKAGRPFAVYTNSSSIKLIVSPKPPPKSSKGVVDDHKDLGHLLCHFMGVIQRLDGVKINEEEASATWTVEVPIEGGSFKAIVEYGPKALDEIDDAVKAFARGDVAHFHAEWDGMDAKNSKTPTFTMSSMSVVNVVDIIKLATPAGEDAPAGSKQQAAKGRPAAKATTAIKKEKDARPKRKGRESDEEHDEEASAAEPEKEATGSKKPGKAVAGPTRRASRSNVAAPRGGATESASKRARVASP